MDSFIQSYSNSKDGLAQFKNMVQARLRIPHTGDLLSHSFRAGSPPLTKTFTSKPAPDSPKTFQMYSNLITKYENDNYEEEMVAVNTLYSPARQLMEDREAHEAQLVRKNTINMLLIFQLN
jgi:hypothetical protein